jgi:hypothetical protein
MKHVRSALPSPSAQDLILVHESLLFRRLASMRQDVDDHKWFESERAGHDIGYDQALMGWLVKHARNWRQHHRDS